MRYTKTSLGSNYASKQQIDSNLDDIKTAIDDTLSRKGDSPNSMEADLDMNSNQILNLPDAVLPQEPITLSQFNAQSVGTKTTQTLKQKHVATAGQTVFATPAYVIGSNNLSVYINGVRQDGAAYSETSTTSITLTEGAELSDIVEVLVNELPTSTDQVGANNVTYDGSTVAVHLDALTFDTVAAMVAYTDLQVGMKVKTWGYTTLNDGGHGEYEVVAAGTGTADGGSFIDLTGSSLQAKAVFDGGTFNVKRFGARIDGTTDDTTAFQAAIDYAGSLNLGGSQGGRGGQVYIPEGKMVYTGVTIPQGVSLVGDGQNKSLLMLSGVTSVGIKCAAADTGAVADQISRGHFRDFGMFSAETTPTTQIQWNAIGFSRWETSNIFIEFFSGCTGISVIGSTLAGSGGPAQFYNSFYNCFFVRAASRAAGGTALDLGDTNTSFEQVTTWMFFGGRVSASGSGGTGLALRGTGCMFFGVTFEGCTTAVELGSGSTRGADRNSFFGCYWEGNTTNRSMLSNSTGATFRGSFITGGSDSDSGIGTTIDDYGVYQSFAGNSGTQKWEVVQNSSARRPSIVGTTQPSFDLENSAGTDLTIANGAATSSATKHFRVLTSNASTVMFEAGASQLAPGNDNVRNLGSASARWATVYAGTGTINTSDERLKTELLDLSEAEKECAIDLKAAIKKYKFKESVKTKGEDKARIHFGIGAQTVKAIFESHGLDPDQYSIFCYDKWEDDIEVIESVTDSQGNVLQPNREIVRTKAGDRYGIRYDELLCFIISSI